MSKCCARYKGGFTYRWWSLAVIPAHLLCHHCVCRSALHLLEHWEGVKHADNDDDSNNGADDAKDKGEGTSEGDAGNEDGGNKVKGNWRAQMLKPMRLGPMTTTMKGVSMMVGCTQRR